MKSVIFDSRKKTEKKASKTQHRYGDTGRKKNKKRHTNNLNCNNIVIEKRELEKAK